jgi:hypothetical protein
MQTNEILDRLKAHFNYKSDARLGRELGASPANISNWRTRNTIPWEELLVFSVKNNVSLDWIVLGQSRAEDSMMGWDAEIREAAYAVKRIYESNPDIKRALAENLRAFDLAVKNIKEGDMMKEIIERMDKDSREIKERLQALEAVHVPEVSRLAKVSK